ncbi:MAG: hypothetical protein R3275_07000 [Saprospiraceae bacterium]|nr:hypothetical protein [Saprospiraceae bacterium]
MSFRSPIHIAALLFVFLFVIEINLQTYYLGFADIYWQPVYYLLIATGYLFVGLSLSKDAEWKARSKDLKILRYALTLIACLINGYLVYLSFNLLSEVINTIEIDPLNSDVLPAIQLYVRRWLAGEWAYAPMEFPGWTVIPNYLPLVWMPFVVPELLDIDYRWWPWVCFVGYALYYWIKLFLQKDLHPVEYLIKSVVPLFIIWLLLLYDPTIFGHTAEIMIAVFYLILCETILSERPWLAAIGIGLCLLSRYSFGFWLPFYVFVYWWVYGWRPLIYLLTGVAMMVFIFYVIPFLFKDPFVYQKGMAYYMFSAEGEWVVQNWQPEGSKPYHLSRGFGFAIYIYEYINGDIQFKLRMIQVLNVLTSLLTISLIFAAFWWLRSRIERKDLFLIFGLKIYLMVFYSFIHVPYAYLFVLPLLLGLPIFSRIRIWKGLQDGHSMKQLK